MRLLYFSRSFIPSHEANSIHVMNMCEAFTDLGHEVKLFCPHHSEKSSDEIFQYYGVKKKFSLEKLPWPKMKGRGLVYALSSIPRLLSFKPNLVVSRYPYGSFLAAWFGFPFIHDFHDKDWENVSFGKFIFKTMLRSKSLRRMTFNSQALMNFFLEEFPEQKKRLQLFKVLHNGAKNFSLDDKVSLPGANKLKVGYFGNLYKGRGIELIIDIAGKLPNLDFVIVGGSKSDLEFWRSQNLSSNIHFVGFVDPQDVYKYRNATDLLLGPYADQVTMAGNTGNSVDYMNPIKLFEYMSSKKPILTSNLKAIREVLSQENAYLLNYNDPSEWVRTLSDISQDFSTAHNKANKAYESYCLDFTWKARAEKMVT